MATKIGGIGATWRFRIAKSFCYDIHDAATAAILKIFNCQLMLWSVDHDPSLTRMPVSNFSHSGHFHQNHIHDGLHGGNLESLHLLSAPEP